MYKEHSKMAQKDPIATAREILEAEIKAKKNDVLEVDETEEDEEDVDEAKATTEGDCEGEDCEDVDEDEEVEENATAHAADGAKTAPKSVNDKGTEIKTDEHPKGEQPEPKMSKSKTGDVTKEKMKEHMGNLFNNEDLSEEFKTKAETVFEAAINSRVGEINSALVEDFETKLEEAKTELNETLTTRLNDYLEYVVEEWMKENSIALERGLRDDIAEDFLVGLRNLFLENNISIPEEKYDLVDEYAARIETLEEELNNQMENAVVLAKEVRNHKCVEIFADVCEGLIETDREKLKELSEGIEFESVEQYREKVTILKDNYFNEDVSSPKTNTFEEETEAPKYSELSDSMKAYAQSLGRLGSHPASNNEIPSEISE